MLFSKWSYRTTKFTVDVITIMGIYYFQNICTVQTITWNVTIILWFFWACNWTHLKFSNIRSFKHLGKNKIKNLFLHQCSRCWCLLIALKTRNHDIIYTASYCYNGKYCTFPNNSKIDTCIMKLNYETIIKLIIVGLVYWTLTYIEYMRNVN